VEAIEEKNLPDQIANFLNEIFFKLLNDTSVNDAVFNGHMLVNTSDHMFMGADAVKECILSLKSKNSEGFDRIPQRIIPDGVYKLFSSLSRLFELIYEEKKVPEQWLVAKTLPVLKKRSN
jgi:hypothetical protein